MGYDPTASGFTDQRSIHLSYQHQMAGMAGFEPTMYGSKPYAFTNLATSQYHDARFYDDLLNDAENRITKSLFFVSFC